MTLLWKMVYNLKYDKMYRGSRIAPKKSTVISKF